MSRAGFVYVLTNEGLPDHCKIGRTARDVRKRQSELWREYGTVHPFVEAARHLVSDCVAVETMVHRRLARLRIAGSELFKCSVKQAQETIRWAARIVLKRSWLLRVWHSMVLPRPQRARNAGVGRGSRHETAYWKLWVMMISAVMIWGIHRYKPELPDWLPPPVLRLCLALER